MYLKGLISIKNNYGHVKDDNIVDRVLDKMVETFGVKLNK
jgi:hypothetical protein